MSTRTIVNILEIYFQKPSYISKISKKFPSENFLLYSSSFVVNNKDLTLRVVFLST